MFLEHTSVPFLQPAFKPQRDFWVEASKQRFHQLILLGERQPSNGTVRRVEDFDGETHFNLAYGDAPGYALQALLVCRGCLFGHVRSIVRCEQIGLRFQETIYNRHGDVALRHDGRDSTGKHWIKCFNVCLPPPLHPTPYH